MKISTKGRYAVRAMYDIATANKEYVSIAEISKRQAISIKYLERIVSLLVKAGLLTSQKGICGGYKLTKKVDECTILEILTATDDVPQIVPCLSSGVECPRKDKCATVGCWETLTSIIYDYLGHITLQNLIDKKYK
ncbi:MAG: RrF2 family transcriptional regulator [Christensenellales bacterium]